MGFTALKPLSNKAEAKRKHRAQEGPPSFASEHQEQSVLFQWAATQEKAHPELACLYAVPNGGKRDKVTAAKLKREGVKAGVPDICLPVSRGPYHALYIEMKAGDNTPSDTQKVWHQRLREQHNAVRVCWSTEQAQDVILAYLKTGDLPT